MAARSILTGASKLKFLEHQLVALEEAAESAASAESWQAVVAARAKAVAVRDELDKLRVQERDKAVRARWRGKTFDPNESDASRLRRRVARLYQQIEAAQTSGDHQATSALMRQVAAAEDELVRASRGATQDGPHDEALFLAELRAGAEQMPEPHLRVLADAWLQRHKLVAVSRGPRAAKG